MYICICVCIPIYGIKPYFQPGSLSDIVIIANLQLAKSRAWTRVEPVEWNLFWIKLHKSHNHYTMIWILYMVYMVRTNGGFLEVALESLPKRDSNTITKLRSDAFTDWALRSWLRPALKANIVQLQRSHLLFSVQISFRSLSLSVATITKEDLSFGGGDHNILGKFADVCQWPMMYDVYLIISYKYVDVCIYIHIYLFGITGLQDTDLVSVNKLKETVERVQTFFWL